MRRIWWARPSPGTLDTQGEIEARSCAGSLDALARDLPAVEASKGTTGCDNIILCAFNFFIRNTEDNFDVAGVALVGVDTTVCTVRAAAGFLIKSKHISS